MSPAEKARADADDTLGPGHRKAAPLTRAAREAEARAGLQRVLAGVPLTDGAAPWTGADIIRLWALVQLGRPAEVVTNGPPVLIAPGDNWGGRMSMPGERVRADVLQAWREVGRMCGEPLPAPHDASPLPTCPRHGQLKYGLPCHLCPKPCPGTHECHEHPDCPQHGSATKTKAATALPSFLGSPE